MKEKVKICVEVSGGVVAFIHSSYSNIEVVMRDFDNIAEGDDDPLAEFVNDQDETDMEAAGFPYEVY